MLRQIHSYCAREVKEDEGSLRPLINFHLGSEGIGVIVL